MNKYQKDACLLMARSFTNEYIVKNNLDKKKFSLVHEFNKKLGLKVAKLAKTQEQMSMIAQDKAGYVINILEPLAKSLVDKYNIEVDKDTGDIKMEGNLLLMGVSFVFLLIEEDFFTGSEQMYYKRVSMEIYKAAENEMDFKTLKTTNVLVTEFYKKLIELKGL